MLQTLLFFHILGVVMLFSGISMELAAFARLHRASTLAEVRAATLNFPIVGPIMGIGALLVIAMGIAMVYAGGFGWGSAWVNVAFVLTVILAVNGPITNGRRSDAIHALAAKAGEGPLTAEIQAARSDRFLNYSVFLSVCELVAALYVMVFKPDLGPCVWAVILAAAAAAIPTALVLRRRPQPAAAEA
jgi:uncharacterized membrane protein